MAVVRVKRGLDYARVRVTNLRRRIDEHERQEVKDAETVRRIKLDGITLERWLRDYPALR